ncbi:MAG: hypothetical protein GY769_08125 [bacterium]|nr:hypothetical protein [bacterium]
MSEEIWVKSYSDKRETVRLAGQMVELPAGDFTRDELTKIADIFTAAWQRMRDRRGHVAWMHGHDGKEEVER